MATYAIGDVQGCYDELLRLLDHIRFDDSSDQLWFLGDLVNRGPSNLDTLMFVNQLADSAKIVLGNHDLHLLAIVFGGHQSTKSDTFDDVLSSADCDRLCHWLRALPLLVENETHVMTHAGIPHTWNLDDARRYAQIVEEAIRGEEYVHFFRDMYGNLPSVLTPNLKGMDRLRVLTNYFTRMRFIAPDGNLEFQHKLTLDTAPKGFKAWFEYPTKINKHIVFGHWAALNGVTNNATILATDTGCVWGRGLSAIRLEDNCRFMWRDNTLITRK